MQDWTAYDKDDVAAGLQDFLICVEMFVAALAHAYAFPPRDYMDPTHPKSSFLKSVKIMFDVRDVVDDVQYAVDDTVSSTLPHAAVCCFFLKLSFDEIRRERHYLLGASCGCAAFSSDHAFNRNSAQGHPSGWSCT